VFEKANDTFAARHHLRIWRRPGQFGGQSVWVCSATHDINIKFSDQQRTFIHKIDSNIDLERAKVVSDLCSRDGPRSLAGATRRITGKDVERHGRRLDDRQRDGSDPLLTKFAQKRSAARNSSLPVWWCTPRPLRF